MRRSSLVMLSWCVGFVWAAVLIHNAMCATSPPPLSDLSTRVARTPSPDLSKNALLDTRSVLGTGEEVLTNGPQQIATPSKFNYAGNTNTHKFHRTSCRYAGCPNCTARFATREAAIEAGFKPCGVCNP
jgi:hypothetical protein